MIKSGVYLFNGDKIRTQVLYFFYPFEKFNEKYSLN